MRLLAVAAAAVLALALGSGSGEGGIVLQHSVAGVSLGMTKTQVRAVLGSPLRVRHGRSPAGQFVQWVYRRVTVEFQAARRVTVTALRTSSRLERTGGGVGVGSWESVVRSRVPDVSCYTWRSRRQCLLGKLVAGQAVTIFELKRGRVSEVVVGVVQHS